MNLFEYGDAEKKNLDSFTVMARAIRKHYDDDDDKIPPALARIMAKIIDDGFLDGVIAEQAELIAHSKRVFERNEKLRRDEERKLWSAVREIETLKRTKEDLETLIADMQKIAEEEVDPFLLGARKAYKFIYHETHDKEKASKAFNSYLQGIGKWKQYNAEEEMTK